MNRNNGKPDFKVVKNRQGIGQCLQETFYCNYNHKAILATAEELSGGTSDPAEMSRGPICFWGHHWPFCQIGTKRHTNEVER